MDEAGLLRVLGAAAGVHAAGLEVAAVRAARDLAVAALPRQPDLEVVGPAGGEAGVAGSQRHHPVGQLQPLQHGLGATDHALVLGLRLLRRGDADQLDLGELVLADHALGVLAGGTGLGAEAGRQSASGARAGPPRRRSRRRRGWSAAPRRSGSASGRWWCGTDPRRTSAAGRCRTAPRRGRDRAPRPRCSRARGSAAPA